MLKSLRPSPLQIVFGGIGFVSLIAGAWGFHMLSVSEKFIKTSLPSIALQGKTASVEGCVDITMEWYETCEAMKSLCESSVGRVMAECLAGQDRGQACAEYGDITKDTHFGFKECQDRGVTRFNRKACATTYRVVDQLCDSLKKQKPPLP